MKESPRAACFATLGCRLNQLETEEIASAFRMEGFDVEAFRIEGKDEAGEDGQEEGAPCGNASPFLCVINTCAVTSKAEQKARRIIRHAVKAKGFAAVIVTGCYAQTDAKKISAMASDEGELERLVVFPGSLKDSLKRLARHLRLFIEESGGASLPSLKEINGAVRSFCLKEEREASGGHSMAEEPSEPITPKPAFKPKAGLLGAGLFSFHSRALLKVQDGCSSRCAFCKTRLARGHSVSVPSDKIIERARQIEASGMAELVLTGVNLRQYSDPLTGRDFSGLLGLLLEMTERVFIRISSLSPETVTAEFAQVIANKRICPFFHLSVQSGSEKILKSMGRGYSPQQVTEAARLLRSAKESPFVSCDIITGFPGETDDDFRMTEELCKALNFAHIHVFPFSPREGTPAASMKGRVPERVSRERAARLEELSREGRRRYRELWAGKALRGVFEYSKESGKARVFTVNALSLPLDCSEFLRAGGAEAKALQDDPSRFRGAPVLVKVAGRGEKERSLSAELKNFLFTGANLC